MMFESIFSGAKAQMSLKNLWLVSLLKIFVSVYVCVCERENDLDNENLTFKYQVPCVTL